MIFRSGWDPTVKKPKLTNDMPTLPTVKKPKLTNDLPTLIKMYEICHASIGGGMMCGQYMPPSYFKRQNDKWKFYCGIDWIQAINSKNGTEIFNHMVNNGFGTDPTSWPNSGCGARFRPWAKFPSKVVEIIIEGVCYVFLADSLPVQIEQEMAACSEKFAQALQLVTANDLQNNVGMAKGYSRGSLVGNLPGVCNL